MKLSKQATLYVYRPGKKYQCGECLLWLAGERCLIHGPQDEIEEYATCGYWVGGKPMGKGTPSSAVTKTESGYVERKGGYSCAKCRHYLAKKEDCELVERDSDGDTPGRIDSAACCSAWAPKDYRI